MSQPSWRISVSPGAQGRARKTCAAFVCYCRACGADTAPFGAEAPAPRELRAEQRKGVPGSGRQGRGTERPVPGTAGTRATSEGGTGVGELGDPGGEGHGCSSSDSLRPPATEAVERTGAAARSPGAPTPTAPASGSGGSGRP